MFARQDSGTLTSYLRTYFYNTLAGGLLDDDSVRLDNVNDKIAEQIRIMITAIFTRTIEHETNRDNVILTDGNLYEATILNQHNCPEIYKTFFEGLKEIINKFKEDKGLALELAQLIINFRNGVMASELFIILLPTLKQFILEIKGLKIVLDETNITVGLIRKMFYEGMQEQIEQAIRDEIIFLKDLKEQEGFIYIGLPGLTLLEALIRSQNCPGINLNNSKMLTMKNCPSDEQFQLLTKIMMNTKEKLHKYYGSPLVIRSEELLAIKHLCLQKGEDRPKNIQNAITDSTLECAALINDMSMKISQSPVYQQLSNQLITDFIQKYSSSSSSMGHR